MKTRHLLIIVLIGVTIMGFRWHFISLPMPGNFTLYSDMYFSSFSRSSFENQIMLCAQKKKSIYETATDLKNNFSYIKDVSINYCPSGAIVHISSYKPTCYFNESSVFVEQGYVFAESIFEPLKIAGLPRLVVPLEINSTIVNTVLYVLNNIQQDILADYIITIVSKNYISLVNKTDMKFNIICSVDQHLSLNMFDQCDMVKKNIIAKGAVEKDVAWAIDTRFANYIVAYRA